MSLDSGSYVFSLVPGQMVVILTASHEIDGVRKEKERLTAAWTSHTFARNCYEKMSQGSNFFRIIVHDGNEVVIVRLVTKNHS